MPRARFFYVFASDPVVEQPGDIPTVDASVRSCTIDEVIDVISRAAERLADNPASVPLSWTPPLADQLRRARPEDSKEQLAIHHVARLLGVSLEPTTTKRVGACRVRGQYTLGFTRFATPVESRLAIGLKLYEEVAEVMLDSGDPREYADVMQALHDFALVNGVSWDAVMDKSYDRLARDGGFLHDGVARIWTQQPDQQAEIAARTIDALRRELPSDANHLHDLLDTLAESVAINSIRVHEKKPDA